MQVARERARVVEQVTSQREKEKVSPLVFQTRPHLLISTLPSTYLHSLCQFRLVRQTLCQLQKKEQRVIAFVAGIYTCDAIHS